MRCRNNAAHLVIAHFIRGFCPRGGAVSTFLLLFNLGQFGLRWRRVGNRAGNAPRSPFGGFIRGQLFTAQCIALRVNFFLCQFTTGEINIEIDLRVDIAGTDNRRDQRHNAHAVNAFQTHAIFKLAVAQAPSHIGTALRQQASILVNNGDILLGHARHGGRHQMHNGIDLLAAQYTAICHLHHD